MRIERAVVYKGVLKVNLKVLGEHVVDPYFIISLARIPFSLRTVEVVTGLYVQFLLNHRGYGKCVEAVCLVSGSGVDFVGLQVGALVINRLEAVTGRMDILRTERPIIENVLAAYCVTVLGKALYAVTALACVRAGPSESAYAQAFHRHNPRSADYVLTVVNVLHVNTLSVEHADLVVEKRPAGTCLEQVALQLDTYVAAV